MAGHNIEATAASHNDDNDGPIINNTSTAGNVTGRLHTSSNGIYYISLHFKLPYIFTNTTVLLVIG